MTATRRGLCGPGDADQVSLGIGEVADHQTRRYPDGAQLALPAEAIVIRHAFYRV